MTHPIHVLVLAIAADLCHRAWQAYVVPLPHYLAVALFYAVVVGMCVVCMVAWLVFDFMWGMAVTVAAERRERT